MTFLDKINETAAFPERQGDSSAWVRSNPWIGTGRTGRRNRKSSCSRLCRDSKLGPFNSSWSRWEVVYGELAGRKVLALQGPSISTKGNHSGSGDFPVRVMKVLGCEGVIVTNAAGGIGYNPGNLMAISDHINMTGQKSIDGWKLGWLWSLVSPDMSKAYTPEYRATAHEVAKNLVSKLDEGVYIGVTGPTYKNTSRIRCL